MEGILPLGSLGLLTSFHPQPHLEQQSQRPYARVKVEECKAWVLKFPEFDLGYKQNPKSVNSIAQPRTPNFESPLLPWHPPE